MFISFPLKLSKLHPKKVIYYTRFAGTNIRIHDCSPKICKIAIKHIDKDMGKSLVVWRKTPMRNKVYSYTPSL